MKFSLLASMTFLSLAIAMPAPAAALVPTFPAVLPNSLTQKGDPSPICAATKTLFGPYTLNHPVPGYSQSDEFYAIKLADGTYEIYVKGTHDPPFGRDNDQLFGDLNPKGGIGGGIVATEVFQGSWGPTTKTIGWGGSVTFPSWPRPTPMSWGTCLEKTTVCTPGQWGSPTVAPKWPELAGAKVRPVEARDKSMNILKCWLELGGVQAHRTVLAML